MWGEIILVSGLLLVLPLVVGGSGETEIPKVIAAELGIGILVAKRIWRGEFPGKKFWPFWALALLISLNSPGWWGNGFRLQGGFMVILLGLWAMGSAGVKIKLGPLIWAMALAALTIGGILIQPNASGRAVGTLGEPNALAGSGVFLWPQAGWLGLLPMGALIWMSGSRSSLVAVVIQLAVLVFLQNNIFPGLKSGVFTRRKMFYLPQFIPEKIFRVFLRSSNKKVKPRAVAVTALVFVVASWGLPFLAPARIWENRTEIWQTAIAAGWKKPIWGWGAGNVEAALAQTADKLENNLRFEYVDSAHNWFLDGWVQGGIVGLGLMLIISIGAILKLSVRPGEKSELVMLLGLLVVVSFNPASVVSLVQLWWLLGKGWEI